MRIRDYRDIFIAGLSTIYGDHEAESFFYLALERLHQMRRIDLALKPDESFSAGDIQKWDEIVGQLKEEVPIQYVLGVTNFCGLDFKVNPAVLIPRPETEELIQWIVDDNNGKSVSILDIGTGSGCVAISLAKLMPMARVEALDISNDALAIARENAQTNNVQIGFNQCDILEAESLDKYDIIVSNPPYVRNLEKSEIKNNVLDHEPHLALFVDDDDALLFYKKIADLAIKSLTDDGALYFEINQYLASETMTMLSEKGFSSELKKDIYGNNRMIKAIRLTRNATPR